MKFIICTLLLSVTLTRLHAENITVRCILPEEEGESKTFLSGIENFVTGILKPILNPGLPVVSVTSYPTSEEEYGYHHDSRYPPEHWADNWPTCGGIRQSPINLDIKSCKKDNAMFQLKFNNFDSNPISTTVTNVGHSVQFSFTFNKNVPTLNRGARRNKYNFAQLHFHFGQTDEEGSEHTINYKRTALEMHLVFYKSLYKDTTTAANFRDGLVVIGVLFNASENATHKLFTNYLKDVQHTGQTIIVKNNKGTRLIDFIEKLDTKFIRYDGSLTTPACSEAVTWYVSTQLREISYADLEAFRELQGEEGPIAGNFRPIQPLNGRKCYIH